jgi:hypothetical protein
MKKLLPLMLIGLAACTMQPQLTLEEKLAGKSPDEKREILLKECKEEAAWKTPGRYGHNSSSHIKRMQAICEAMHNVTAK